MNRLSKLLLTLALLPFESALAQTVDSEVEATVTVTSVTGTTNGQTITYSSDARTFTNNPVANPAKQIQATNTIGYVATNLTLHFTRSPFSDGITLEASGTNYVKFLSALNSNLVITLSAGWGTVGYVTNLYTNGTPVVVPIGFEGDKNAATNIASSLVAGIGTYSTNSYGELVKALANFMNLSQSQTASNKNLVGGSASALSLKSAIMSGSNNVTFDMSSSVVAELNGGGIRFGSTSSNTYAILVPTDNDPAKIAYYYVTNSGGAALFADVSGFTPYSSPYLLNLGSAIKIFPVIDGSLWPPNTQPTNNWKSANIWANGSNAFKGFLTMTGGVLIVTGTMTNISGAFVALTVTNLQALGGNLSGMTFSGLSGTGLQTSNSVRLGTNVILGDLSLGSGTITTVTPGYNVLDIGTNSYIRVTGSPGQDWIFTGVKAGAQRDGLFCFLDFQTGFNVTAANESAAVNTGNANQRLRTLNGGDSQSVGNALGFVVWDPGLSRWTFAWLNRGSQTANGTFATNAIPFANGTGTNLTVRSSDSNNIPLSVEGQLNQRSNLLQFIERTSTTTNVDSAFGATGGLHIGGYSDAGGSNLVVEIAAQIKGSNNVTGTLSVGGTLTATGAVVVAGAENVTGTLNVGGNVTATNNMTVTGFVSAGPGSFTGSNATSVALVAVGGASATTNLTEVKNSAGQIVAGTTQDGVPFMRITNSPQNNLIGGRLFLQTASGTANTNTGATFQSWLGTGDGSLTIPSGLFNQYKQVKGEFNGNYWTSSGSAGNVYTELDIGGSPVMRQMTSTIGASIANGDFRLEFTVTSRSVGSSGSAAVSGFLLLMSSGLNPVSYHFTNQVVTLDNRGALAVDFRGTNAQSVDSFITTDGIMFAR